MLGEMWTCIVGHPTPAPLPHQRPDPPPCHPLSSSLSTIAPPPSLPLCLSLSPRSPFPYASHLTPSHTTTIPQTLLPPQITEPLQNAAPFPSLPPPPQCRPLENRYLTPPGHHHHPPNLNLTLRALFLHRFLHPPFSYPLLPPLFSPPPSSHPHGNSTLNSTQLKPTYSTDLPHAAIISTSSPFLSASHALTLLNPNPPPTLSPPPPPPLSPAAAADGVTPARCIASCSVDR